MPCNHGRLRFMPGHRYFCVILGLLPLLACGSSENSTPAGASRTGMAEGPQGARCLDLKESRPYAPGAHILSTYGSREKLSKIIVNVGKEDVPSTLYLISYEPTVWSIRAADASIAKIYVSSHSKDTVVEGVPTGAVERVPYKGYLSTLEPPGAEQLPHAEALEAARQVLGGVESTIQAGTREPVFDIPVPAAATLISRGTQANNVKDECADACPSRAETDYWDGDGDGVTNWKLDVQGPSISAKTSGSGGFAEVRSLRGASCGKYYFELEFALASSGSTADFGLTADQVATFSPMVAWTAKNGRVGIALDLEDRYAYALDSSGPVHGFLGKSVPGALGSNSYAINRLSRTRVVPFVDLKLGDKVTIFDSDFKYPVPSGFKAGLP